MRYILGPCVIDDYVFEIAEELKSICSGLDWVFKASYDKANRSELESYRGPGLEEGLRVLSDIKDMGLRVTSDVHTVEQVEKVKDVLDIIQVPAFLCRQTDLLLAAGGSGLEVNLKKGQFMSPWQMGGSVGKVRHGQNMAGHPKGVTIIERGTCFGYNNLVVDFRGVSQMRQFWPVIFDATHSVQLPGVGGEVEYVPVLARAAVAVGVDGIFMEVHSDPEKAKCDGANSVKLSDLPGILEELEGM